MAEFIGTSGDDSLVGTINHDDFHLEDGGDDTAIGGGAADAFYMGASLTAEDRLDGGGGSDTVWLQGDYSAGLVIGPDTLHAMERIQLAAGFSYDLSGFTGVNVGASFVVDAATLTEDDSARVDLSGLKVATWLYGGAGADELIGGRGDDKIDGRGGADTLVGGEGNDQLTIGNELATVMGGAGGDEIIVNRPLFADDRIDGGDGSDYLSLNALETGVLQLQEETVTGVERIYLSNFADFHLVTADGNVAAGAILTLTPFVQDKSLTFDGSAETDGSFNVAGAGRGVNHLTGGGGADTLTGAGHADTLIGGAGADMLDGMSGADQIVGGLGGDTMSGGLGQDRFVYASADDSTPAAPDLIVKFGQNDILDLSPIDADTTQAGDQAFNLVGAFTGHAGELTVAFDHAVHATVVSGDVDGDGVADLVIHVDAKHPDGFVL